MKSESTLRKSYIYMHQNCGIKRGDYVKILRKPKSYELGWNDSAPQDIYEVGTIAKVVDINNSGFNLNKIGSFPFFVLEKVDSPEVVVKVKNFEHKVIIKNNELHVGCTVLTESQIDCIINAWKNRE